MKLIVDLMYEAASPRCTGRCRTPPEFGGYTRGRGWWTSGPGKEMRRHVSREVQDGTFTRELI